MIEITLPDGSKREYAKGSTPLDIAKSISEGLARNVLAAKINGDVKDAFTSINENVTLQLLTWNDIDGKQTFWHSSAHLMAEALESLYPNIKLGIGPAIEQGFYYDIDFGEYKFTDKDIPQVEQKMKALAKEKLIFERREISKSDATKYFTDKGDEYKLELIDNLQDGEITFYQQGNFTDLCKGPHIPNTGFIKALKITSVAGAYWRGDEKNVMLTRLYGITFPKQKELTEYLEMVELAKQRDHRKLGKELEFFTFSQKVGMGLPLWLPKGVELREKLENFLKKAQKKAGYQQVISPHIGQKELYITSGHYAKYGEDSFQPIQTPAENEEFLLKPMNCPHHCEMYASKPHSYKELPIRFAEFGTVYRYEQSGELHGLTRVRGFTQDDAHIFCTPNQVKEEFKKVIDLILYVFNTLGFEDFSAQISLRDPEDNEKYIGGDENWNKAEQAIKEASEEKGLNTVIEYGEAAFYGPKLDFMVKDALGRNWQLGTVQVDYNLPERFELTYVDANNEKQRPIMIHRAPFGSMERFIAILIENSGGDFPLWLAPTQVAVLPLSNRFDKEAKNLAQQLEVENISTFLDDRNEKVNRKIRDAETKKIPYMLILGEKEIQSQSVSVRKHKEGDLGVMKTTNFIQHIKEEMFAHLSEYQEEKK